jgi:hypothetical protein
MPGVCKVGITNDIEKRLNSLNNTSVPTKFQIYKIFYVENAEILEREIFDFFHLQRKNNSREFI